MMQFLAPTLQFLVGYLNGEALTTAHLVCFFVAFGQPFCSLAWTLGATAGEPGAPDFPLTYAKSSIYLRPRETIMCASGLIETK